MHTVSELFRSERVITQMREAKDKVNALLRTEIVQNNSRQELFNFLDPGVTYGMIRICGGTRCWDQEDISTLYHRMTQVYAGLYRGCSEFFYCLSGDGDGISVWMGAEIHRLKAVRETISGLLDDVMIEDRDCTLGDIRRSVFGSSSCSGGVITGMPTVPEDQKGKWRNPLDAICTGARDMRFMVVFLCREIAPDILDDEMSVIRNEQTYASSRSEVRVQADATNRVDEVIKIYDYLRYGQLLEDISGQLFDSLSLGGWNVAGYYCAGDWVSANALAALITAAYGGIGSGPEPVRCMRNNQVGTLIDRGAMLGAESRHPLGVASTILGNKSGFSSLCTTQVSSRQLASFCMLPGREYPGYYVNEPARFDLNSRRTAEEEDIKLGDVMYSPYTDEKTGTYEFPVPDLDRHALIVGATGGGKSNTVRSLLHTLYREKHIPFLVIESAKSEYWEMANMGIDVLALQLGTHNSPFRMNPFECEQNFPLQTHVDTLMSTFRAAFEMYPPMPFILEQSVYAVYEDYGWDVATGENRRGVRNYPTLSDLYWQIPVTVDNSAYDKEIKDNVTGSLQTRIRSLIIGGKGKMMDCRTSTPLAALLQNPLVLELENLGDDQTKAFVMGLLMTRLYEFRRVESAGISRAFSHLLIIEEAHRLLKRVNGTGEGNQTQAASVEFFCNMLSEIRSYGQGIMIADQSPEKLAEDAIRNTNLKIVHRIVDARDREIAAGAMHMDEIQREALSMLRRGVAAVYAEGDHRPRLVKMPKMTAGTASDRDTILARAGRHPLFRRTEESGGMNYPICQYCTQRNGGRCMNPEGRHQCEEAAGAVLSGNQIRYYEDEIGKFGPSGALIWKIVEYIFIRECEEQGQDEETARRNMLSQEKDVIRCLAGYTLDQLKRLDPKMRGLCSDRLENRICAEYGN